MTESHQNDLLEKISSIGFRKSSEFIYRNKQKTTPGRTIHRVRVFRFMNHVMKLHVPLCGYQT